MFRPVLIGIAAIAMLLMVWRKFNAAIEIDPLPDSKVDFTKVVDGETYKVDTNGQLYRVASPDKWTFVERDMFNRGDSAGVQHAQTQPLHHPHYQHQRNELGSRETDNSLHLDHHSNTDSDMVGMNDSEDEDEASHYDTMVSFMTTNNEGPAQIVVEGSGTPGVNGKYHQDGYFENACKYGKEGTWNGTSQKFNIFQCNVSNNTRHWYISIVPVRGNPGTSADIDFYTAPVTQDCTKVPPADGWSKAQEGADPPPRLSFRHAEGGRPEGQENDGSWLGRENGDERSTPQTDSV